MDESKVPSDQELLEAIQDGNQLAINDDFVQDFFTKRLGREVMGEAKQAARNEVP